MSTMKSHLMEGWTRQGEHHIAKSKHHRGLSEAHHRDGRSTQNDDERARDRISRARIPQICQRLPFDKKPSITTMLRTNTPTWANSALSARNLFRKPKKRWAWTVTCHHAGFCFQHRARMRLLLAWFCVTGSVTLPNFQKSMLFLRPLLKT